MKEWSVFLLSLEKEIGKETVEKWIRTLKILHFDARNIFLEAKEHFQLSWFKEYILPKLGSFKNANGQPIRCHLRLAGQMPQKKETYRQTDKLHLTFDKIEVFFQFSNFFPSAENEVVLKLFSQLAGFDFKSKSFRKPTISLSSFNPIFIYGVKYSGKTHLLNALAKALIEQGLNVVFVHAKTFTKHVVSAIRGGYMHLFRQKYRSIDVLIVEDIHILARKAATQEEFFHTFNTLHTSGKQIILSANQPPQSLEEIEPRLISRFEWGITCSLEKLNKQDLAKAIELREEFFQVKINAKQKQFLLTHFSSSSASLFRALETLILRAPNNIEDLEQENIKSLLSDLLKNEQEQKITPEIIVTNVAKYFGIQTADLIERNQTKEFAYPRQIAMYLMRTELYLPFTKIAKFFHRDHSTIMSSVKKIEKIKDKEALQQIRNDF